jgi:hypothetical protein
MHVENGIWMQDGDTAQIVCDDGFGRSLSASQLELAWSEFANPPWASMVCGLPVLDTSGGAGPVSSRSWELGTPDFAQWQLSEVTCDAGGVGVGGLIGRGAPVTPESCTSTLVAQPSSVTTNDTTNCRLTPLNPNGSGGECTNTSATATCSYVAANFSAAEIAIITSGMVLPHTPAEISEAEGVVAAEISAAAEQSRLAEAQAMETRLTEFVCPFGPLPPVPQVGGSSHHWSQTSENSASLMCSVGYRPSVNNSSLTCINGYWATPPGQTAPATCVQ